MSLNEQAINLLQGYIIECTVLGKLLINFGVKFRNSETIYQGLDQQLLFKILIMKRLDESTEWIKKSCAPQLLFAKNYLFKEFLFANKFFQGKFEEIEPKSQNYLFNGLLLWVQGQNDQSLQLISQFTDDFPILMLVISKFSINSWIYQEQNKKEEVEKILSDLQQTYPKLQLFCQRQVFLSSGPYSQYIKDNQKTCEMLDSKKYYAIKILAFYLEMQGYAPFIDELLAAVEKNALILQELLSGLDKAILLQTYVERNQVIANIIQFDQLQNECKFLQIQQIYFLSKYNFNFQ